MPNFDEFMKTINGRADRRRASDAEVARLSGVTIEQFDADTTAPDPLDVPDDIRALLNATGRAPSPDNEPGSMFAEVCR